MTIFLKFVEFVAYATLLVGFCAFFGWAHAQMWEWLQKHVNRTTAMVITSVVAILVGALVFALVETMFSEFLRATGAQP